MEQNKSKHKIDFEVLEVIGGHFSEEGDVIVGVADLAPGVQAAMVQVYPSGIIERKSRGEELNLGISDIKAAIVEVSSTAGDDYRKNVVFSRMSDIREPLFLGQMKPVEESMVSTVPCRLAIVGLPPISINMRDEVVLNYFKQKFLNKTVSSMERVMIDVAGYALPFAISVVYPKERVLIGKNTFISFIIPVGMVGEKVGFDLHPQIPEDLELLLLQETSSEK
jgi:hypothetical protein